MTRDARRILADFERHRRIPDFLDEGFGRLLIDIATDGIQDGIADEVAPDGSSWPDLSDAYEAWKSRNFPGQGMGHLHELMADPAQVTGLPEVTTDRATVTYGVSEQARREAAWFQSTRPFWGFYPLALRLIQETIQERFETLVGR